MAPRLEMRQIGNRKSTVKGSNPQTKLAPGIGEGRLSPLPAPFDKNRRAAEKVKPFATRINNVAIRCPIEEFRPKQSPGTPLTAAIAAPVTKSCSPPIHSSLMPSVLNDT